MEQDIGRRWCGKSASRLWFAVSAVSVVPAALALGAARVVAQVPSRAPSAGVESVTVVPGSVYRTGTLGRFFYGEHYRSLWTAPLTVAVLSLDRYAGGLRPLERGGSQQTKSLRFSGADGREYVFRSIDKDPSPSLPPELRGTYARHVLRDLISAQHPGGSLVVARLLDAAGVLHSTPQLAVMPDDPRLGEFRQEFAGMLGLIELRPTGDPDDAISDGTGMMRVASSQKLLERITEHPNERVDSRAFLAARLFDMFVGDWDRHPDQWRWARTGTTPNDQWLPIPRDRDWALVKLDGLAWSLARFAYPYPQFVSFDATFSDVIWLTWTGRALDRRLLSELSRPVWDSVATALQANLSDSVIDEAIHQLPSALAAASSDFLRSTLISRREHLRKAARRFYDILSNEPEIHATDAGELVEVTRVGPRITDITMHQRSKSGLVDTQDWYHRRFDASETREIRIYLYGGADQVVVRGAANGRPLVRVVGGRGRDAIADSTAGGHAGNFRYYDTDSTTVVAPGTHAHIDRRTYVPPRTRRGFIDPPRDWGSRWRTVPWVGYSTDAGLFLGGGPAFERYGFRQHPYALQTSLLAGYAFGAGKGRVEFSADMRRENSDTHLTFVARASALDVLHFYGFGNETPSLGSKDSHLVEQRASGLEPMLHVPVARRLTFDLGISVRRTTTELDSGSFINDANPFGVGTFKQFGARAGLTFDSRDMAANAKRGVFASLQAAEYPDVWSAEGPFGHVRGQVATYLSAPVRLEPVLALRVGGQKAWGDYPYFDAALLGGGSTLRGWRQDRFAGDASIYGNAELRLFLTRFFLLLPGDLGAFGLADAGRVYVSGESSDTWHTAFGGGLWVSFLGRGNTFSVSLAHGREGNAVYFRSGMPF